MAETSRTRRLRWYQFRLRTLLLLTTVLVFGLVAWRVYIAPRVAYYRPQQATTKLIEKLGGSYQATPAPDWLRRLTGEDFQDVELVDLADCDDPDAYIDQVAALPKLEMLAVGGEKFTDEHLRRLQRTKALRGLVLDSSCITPEALETLTQWLPALDVHLSQRRIVLSKPFDACYFAGDLGEAHGEVRERLSAKFFVGYFAGIELQLAVADDPRLPRLWQLNGPLIELTMAGQGVTDGSLGHLERLTSLWRLHLNRARLTDDGLLRLRGMGELQELSLRGSQVTDDVLSHLTPLRKLWGLYLDDTPMTGRGLAVLEALPELKRLALARTKIDDGGLAQVNRLKKLEEIYLQGTPITDAGLVHLAELSGLKWLELNGTQVTSAGLERLKGLTNLAVLMLDGTKVSDEGLKHLADLPKLRYLSLNGTAISDAGLADLKNVGALKTVRLRATKVTADGLDALKKALPNCQIDWDNAK